MVSVEGLVDGKGISDVVAVGHELTRSIALGLSLCIH